MTQPSELLTSAEAARRLHIGEKLLRKLRQAGKIRYVALSERKILFRPADCDEFIAAQARKDEPCAPPRPANHTAGKKPARAPSGGGVIIPFSEQIGRR